MKRLKGISNYWVSIWDKYYRSTQWDFLFFWIVLLQKGIEFIYAQLTYGWPVKEWAIIAGITMILISFWLFYKRIKRRNTNLEFNDKNIVYKTIDLKFKEKEETKSYNDIEKIEVQNPWLRGIFYLVVILFCMAVKSNRLDAFREAYFDWIFFFILSAILLFWRSRYCYICIKFKGSQEFSSCTIRDKAKNIINELSEIKALKDTDIVFKKIKLI